MKLVLSQTQPIHVGDRVVARCQTPRGPKTYHGTLVHLSVNGALVQTEDTMESIPPADLRKDDEATPG